MIAFLKPLFEEFAKILVHKISEIRYKNEFVEKLDNI